MGDMEAMIRQQMAGVLGDIPSKQDPTPVTGSCLCKAVTYKTSGAPLFNTICHCFNCRRAGGGVAQMASIYLASHITVSGKENLKTHSDSDVDSKGRVDRQFCVTCGSPMFTFSPAVDQFFTINAGTLDREYINKWKPSVEQYVETQTGFCPRLVAADAPRFTRSILSAKVE